MGEHKPFTGMRWPAIIALAAATLVSAGALPAWGHGGKSHGGTGFSSFQAVQKAAELYDRLIEMDKLEEAWETELTTIDVSTRQAGDRQEYVVRFRRTDGDPDSVYFFFDQQGEYSGSNFTGQ
ncbi:MAG TPA: DUF6488 family protein [Desulfosarcina sp.]|nr:DUF6488 family protein [Desulfosarcina sp.]